MSWDEAVKQASDKLTCVKASVLGQQQKTKQTNKNINSNLLNSLWMSEMSPEVRNFCKTANIWLQYNMHVSGFPRNQNVKNKNKKNFQCLLCIFQGKKTQGLHRSVWRCRKTKKSAGQPQWKDVRWCSVTSPYHRPCLVAPQVLLVPGSPEMDKPLGKKMFWHVWMHTCYFKLA